MDKETVIVELYSIIEASGLADLVDRNFLTTEEIPDTAKKVIMLLDAEENGLDYRSSGNVDVDFNVDLICQVQSIKNLSSEMIEFDKKIKKLLTNNRKLNGKAFSSQVLPLTEKGVDSDKGRFVRPLRIQYEGVVTDGF